MTIWLLGLVLMASVAALGYRQGVIRLGFSFVAILLGALLAPPLGKFLKPLLLAVGVKNPMLLWALGPFIVFFIISAIFKACALPMHQKVDVHYKYHAGDLRLALWERLNRRLGLCVGLVNGAAYFIIIAFLIYCFSYWTFQMASADQDPTTLRVLNRLGQDLQSTGFAKAARAVDSLPKVWYDSADLAGLIYNNPLSEARLSRYPAFLGLAERPEFKDLGSDAQFAELRQKHGPLLELIGYPKVDNLLKNADFVQLVWNTVVPDMEDLCVFLETGQSPKYESQKILGRWKIDVGAMFNVFRRLKPNMPNKERLALRLYLTAAYEKTSLVAMTDHQLVLKNVPPLRLPAPGTAPSIGTQTLPGKWDEQGGKYLISFSGGAQQDCAATIEGDRLTINASELALIFIRED